MRTTADIDSFNNSEDIARCEPSVWRWAGVTFQEDHSLSVDADDAMYDQRAVSTHRDDVTELGDGTVQHVNFRARRYGRLHGSAARDHPVSTARGEHLGKQLDSRIVDRTLPWCTRSRH